MPQNLSMALREPDADSPASLIAAAASRIGGIGRNAAAIAGSADDLAVLTDQATRVFGEIQSTLGDMIAENRRIAEGATQGVAKAAETHSTVRQALDKATSLADSVTRVRQGIQEVSSALRQVADASEVINKIAFQTRIVAFNASVEAVRAGDSGRGFGVVAQAVKDLAQQVGSSSRQIAVVIDDLTARVSELEAQIERGGEAGQSSDAGAIVRVAIDSFETNFGAVERLMQETANRSSENLSRCDESVEMLRTFGSEFAQSVEIIQDIRREGGHLLQVSEQAIADFANSGVETEDSVYIRTVTETAEAIGQCFSEAVAVGDIGLAQLFDDRYVPIPGSNPPQFRTAFVDFTDRVLPQFQEAVLDLSPLITFCAAVDRNAFLPTHNLKFSQAQGRDPVWNAANSRNRRIFNDRTGLRAAQNRHPFLLQTYRREMSAGQFVLMKDVSAPIWVNGKHWGALRIGYRFAD